jgi:hypothetical protein
MTSEIEVVYAIRGEPFDPSQEQWPCTVHDLRSRRLRYQYVPRYIALALGEFNGLSKMSARWCPNVGDRGEWQLFDLLPDNVTVIP